MAFFGSTQGAGFQFVTIDANTLAGIYNARTAINTAGTAQFLPQAQTPAVTAPWQLNTEPQTLARRIASVRQLTDFINTSEASVAAAGDDVDARATFALYNALSDLQTLAQYASEDRTLDSELGRLDQTFQTGLRQVQDYLGTTALDKLDLLFGSKDSKVKSAVDIGEDSNDYSGKVIQTGARDDILGQLDGTEQFTISLTKGGETDVVTVDLSAIPGDLTIDTVVDEINRQIDAVKLVDAFGDPQLDENGDPIVDENGDPVAKYLSRFEVRSNENFDWLIGIDGVETEDVSLGASGDASVYVASTFDSVVTDATDKVRINRLTDAATGLEAVNRADFSAGSAALSELAEDVAISNGADAADPGVDPVTLSTRTAAIGVDSQGFTYLVGTTAGDTGSQLGDGENDAFLTKLDSQGEVVFQRLLGGDGTAEGYALTIDANDNVIIAGQTTGRVDGIDVLSGNDSFIVKYSSSGTQLFRSQLDTVANDAALAVTTNSAGDIYVGGYADGAVGQGTTAVGGRDALLLKLDGLTGAISDARLFGTTGLDQVKALAVDADDNLLVAGEENGSGVVTKFDGTDLATVLSRSNLGDLGGGSLSGIAVTGGSEAGPGSGGTGTSAAQTFTDLGARHLYEFDGDTGSSVKDSIGSLSGAYVGDAAPTGEGLTDGSDASANFDGSGDFLSLRSRQDYGYATTTFAFNFRTDTDAGRQTLLSFKSSDGASAGADVYIENGQLYAAVDQATGADGLTTSAAAIVTPGTTQNVAITLSNSKLEVFLDGESIGDVNLPNSLRTNTTNMIIGASTGPLGTLAPEDYFSGQIDDIAVFDDVLSETDIDAGAEPAAGGGSSQQRIVVSGTTSQVLTSGGTQLNGLEGSLDAFVTVLDDTGSLAADKTRYIGTAAADSATGIAVNGDDIFISGRTNDALAGQTREGARDGFVAKIDAATGDVESLSQFGAFGGRTNTAGIAIDTSGASVLGKLGLRAGTLGDSQDRTLGTQSSLSEGQYFYVAVDGRPARKITVKESDTLRSVAAKINAISLRSVKAKVSGEQLEIEAINDGRVDLIAGSEGRDALRRLGFEPQTLLSSEQLFNFEDDRPPEEQLGGAFALGLEDSFNLRDKTTAKYVLSKIDSALSVVQRAFRSLTFDPIAFQLQEQAKFNGAVSPRLTNQLANYQNALARLQSGGQSSSAFFA